MNYRGLARGTGILCELSSVCCNQLIHLIIDVFTIKKSSEIPILIYKEK
jgi:hypothetical protein